MATPGTDRDARQMRFLIQYSDYNAQGGASEAGPAVPSLVPSGFDAGQSAQDSPAAGAPRGAPPRSQPKRVRKEVRDRKGKQRARSTSPNITSDSDSSESGPQADDTSSESSGDEDTSVTQDVLVPPSTGLQTPEEMGFNEAVCETIYQWTEEERRVFLYKQRGATEYDRSRTNNIATNEAWLRKEGLMTVTSLDRMRPVLKHSHPAKKVVKPRPIATRRSTRIADKAREPQDPNPSPRSTPDLHSTSSVPATRTNGSPTRLTSSPPPPPASLAHPSSNPSHDDVVTQRAMPVPPTAPLPILSAPARVCTRTIESESTSKRGWLACSRSRGARRRCVPTVHTPEGRRRGFEGRPERQAPGRPSPVNDL